MASTAYNQNQITLIVVISICFVLSTLSVVLRYISRKVTSSQLWWDDWLMLIAWVFSFITNVFNYLCIHAGLGQHIESLSPDNLTTFGLTFWLQELSWTLAMGIVVPSILLFYQRLFPIKSWLRRASYIIGFCTVGWTISTFFCLAFQCHPVQNFWDSSIPGGYCVLGPHFYFISGLISMLTVFTVLVLPTPILWQLQVSNAKRLGLMVSFTIGSFVCAMSIARLLAIHNINQEDLPGTAIFAGMWSCVECNIAVVSANIPSFTSIIRYFSRKHGDSSPKKEIRLTTHIYSNATERPLQKSQFYRLDSSRSVDYRFENPENIVTTSVGVNKSDNVKLGPVEIK